MSDVSLFNPFIFLFRLSASDEYEETSEEEDETDTDSSEESSDDDYDGEYESVTTSEEEDDEDLEVVRPSIPKSTSANRIRQQQQRRVAQSTDDEDEDGTSTEVGSEDLSSNQDSGDSSDFGSEFSSGTATECEFTDSEGRPNPFHKQLEIPNIVVEPGSPVTGHRKGVVLDQVLERPGAPVDKMLVTSKEGGGGMSSMTYDSRLKYKTPNVTDRLITEQTKSKGVLQDFSTRRALNLKKNWVGDDAKATEEKKL